MPQAPDWNTGISDNCAQAPSDAAGTEVPPAPPSKVERIKAASHGLRGSVAAELARDSDRFDEGDRQIIRFHGLYEQDDRDVRRERKQAGSDPAWIFMVRCKIPGGILTPDQYLAHDELATRLAGGSLRITTRQDFQFHGVLKHSLKRLLHVINESGVTTLGACGDVERNVMCCPAPFRTPLRTAVQRYSRAISDHLLPKTRAYQEIWLNGEKVASTAEPEEAEPLYGQTYLPRKFKTGMAFPGDNCIDVYAHDIGIIPVSSDESLQGFTVLIGGGMGMTHGIETTFPRLASPLAFVLPDQLLPLVEGIVIIQRDYGDRSNRKHARLKYLVEERGIPWFREELIRRLGWEPARPRPVRWRGTDDHLGWHGQGDGRWFLGVYVENGRIKDHAQMRMKTVFRLLVECYRPEVRLTPQQNILFADIQEADRPAIDALLRDHGVAALHELSYALRHAMACPALPTCGLALTDAERALPVVVRELERQLARLGLNDVQISTRMTGCPNGCARPSLGDIGFVGRTLGKYNIYLGGDFEGTRLNQLYAEMVPTEGLIEVLVPVLEYYRDARLPGERFGDFCWRVGIDHPRNLAPRSCTDERGA